MQNAVPNVFLGGKTDGTVHGGTNKVVRKREENEFGDNVREVDDELDFKSTFDEEVSKLDSHDDDPDRPLEDGVVSEPEDVDDSRTVDAAETPVVGPEFADEAEAVDGPELADAVETAVSAEPVSVDKEPSGDDNGEVSGASSLVLAALIKVTQPEVKSSGKSSADAETADGEDIKAITLRTPVEKGELSFVPGANGTEDGGGTEERAPETEDKENTGVSLGKDVIEPGESLAKPETEIPDTAEPTRNSEKISTSTENTAQKKPARPSGGEGKKENRTPVEQLVRPDISEAANKDLNQPKKEAANRPAGPAQETESAQEQVKTEHKTRAKQSSTTANITVNNLAPEREHTPAKPKTSLKHNDSTAILNNLAKETEPVAGAPSHSKATVAEQKTSKNKPVGEKSENIIPFANTPKKELAAEPAPTALNDDGKTFRNLEKHVAKQTANRVFSMLKSRDQQVDFQLDPPALGKVHLRIVSKGNSLLTTLQTETDAARQVLSKSEHTLRASLETAGFNLEKFSVNVGSENHGAFQERQGSRAHRHGADNRKYSHLDSLDAVVKPSVIQRSFETGRLDISI